MMEVPLVLLATNYAGYGYAYGGLAVAINILVLHPAAVILRHQNWSISSRLAGCCSVLIATFSGLMFESETDNPQEIPLARVLVALCALSGLFGFWSMVRPKPTVVSNSD